MSAMSGHFINWHTLCTIGCTVCYISNMKNFQEFIDYVLSFYGDGGLYPQGRTREQVAYATLYYLDSCNDMVEWGDGDSLDRERVRDVMNHFYD
jgi:hypothetical protein